MHRNLNVRVNNDRGWDYTGNNLQPDAANGAAAGAGAPPVSAAGGINGLAVGPEDAPTGARRACVCAKGGIAFASGLMGSLGNLLRCLIPLFNGDALPQPCLAISMRSAQLPKLRAIQ